MARCLGKTATARGAAAQARALNPTWASAMARLVWLGRRGLNAKRGDSNGAAFGGQTRLLSQGVREEEGCWVALPIKLATV